MIYPEIPKSRLKPSYIAGGIFALLIGIIMFFLFLPNFYQNAFGFKPWEWQSLLPGFNGEFLQGVSAWTSQMILPLILFFCAVASMFMGLSKSSAFMKLCVLALSFGLCLKYATSPFNFSVSVREMMEYVEMALLGIGFVLFVLGVIFRFIKNGSYAPYKANSFHFFVCIYLILFVLFDCIYKYLPLSPDLIANYKLYTLSVLFGLFGMIAGVWMLCTMVRDKAEFGAGYASKKDGKEQNNGEQTAPDAQAQAGAEVQPAPAQPMPGQEPMPAQAAPAEQMPQAEQNSVQTAPAPAEQEETADEQEQGPAPTAQPMPQQGPAPMPGQGPMPAPRPQGVVPPIRPPMPPIPKGQVPPRPPMPNGAIPPRPPMPNGPVPPMPQGPAPMPQQGPAPMPQQGPMPQGPMPQPMSQQRPAPQPMPQQMPQQGPAPMPQQGPMQGQPVQGQGQPQQPQQQTKPTEGE